MKNKILKVTVLVLSLLIIAICIANETGTLAWLKDTPAPVENPFGMSTAAASIGDTYSSTSTSFSSLTCHHSMPAVMYLRCQLILQWPDNDGISADPPIMAEKVQNGYQNGIPIYEYLNGDYYLETTANKPSSNWLEIDGLYYYKWPLGFEEDTTNLLGRLIQVNDNKNGVDVQMKIYVLTSYIQSTPKGNVERAWPAIRVEDNGELVPATTTP